MRTTVHYDNERLPGRRGRANYFHFRVFAILPALATAVVAVLMAYGSASAQEACDPECQAPSDGPTVIKAKPANHATRLDRDANITATFSQGMDRDTLNRNTVRLNQVFGDCSLSVEPDRVTIPCDRGPTLRAKVSYDASTRKVKLDPAERLAKNQWYEATIEGTVTNSAGQEMSERYIWYFQTGSS